MTVDKSKIKDHEHVVRYVAHSKCFHNEDGTVNNIPFTAFTLRKNEPYLSCSCYERAGTTKKERLKNIRKAMTNSDGSWPQDKGYFSIVNTGVVREIGKDNDVSLDVKKKQNATNPYYAGITGIPADSSATTLLMLIATEGNKDFIQLQNIDDC